VARARWGLAAGRIDYATAGHPPQLLFRRDGGVESLTTGDGLLGSRHPDVLGTLLGQSVAFGAGDTLFLFTDGLFEVAARAGGEMLGESGLLSSLGDVAATPAAAVASDILRRVADFGRLGPFEDDVSLIVARLGAPAPPAGPRA
jgi:serine phosphatase RsbU (regulator of sigma subunit)